MQQVGVVIHAAEEPRVPPLAREHHATAVRGDAEFPGVRGDGRGGSRARRGRCPRGSPARRAGLLDFRFEAGEPSHAHVGPLVLLRPPEGEGVSHGTRRMLRHRARGGDHRGRISPATEVHPGPAGRAKARAHGRHEYRAEMIRVLAVALVAELQRGIDAPVAPRDDGRPVARLEPVPGRQTMDSVGHRFVASDDGVGQVLGDHPFVRLARHAGSRQDLADVRGAHDTARRRVVVERLDAAAGRARNTARPARGPTRPSRNRRRFLRGRGVSPPPVCLERQRGVRPRAAEARGEIVAIVHTAVEDDRQVAVRDDQRLCD